VKFFRVICIKRNLLNNYRYNWAVPTVLLENHLFKFVLHERNDYFNKSSKYSDFFCS